LPSGLGWRQRSVSAANRALDVRDPQRDMINTDGLEIPKRSEWR